MLRRSCCALAPRVKGRVPGFASDTLTKVYRDAVHGGGGGAAAAGGERPSATMRYTPWHNEREVTNHVGEIGVMSRLAYELREQDKAAASATQSHAEGQDDHDHDHGHGHKGSRHHPIKRGGGVSAGLPPPPGGAAPTPGPSPVADGVISSLEEYHSRLHSTGAAPQQGRQRAAGRGPRHSGVQLEILGLYRQMLREVTRMDDAETRKGLRTYIRSEFDKNADLSRRHIAKIEWCINTAKRKLEDLQRMSPKTKFSMF